MDAHPGRIQGLHTAGMSASEIARLFHMRYRVVCNVLWPGRSAARQQLRNAVYAGDIMRPRFCDECGSEGDIQAHHHDYTKPLDVEWLCQACHTAKHIVDRSYGRPTHEQIRAVWAVSKARQVDRAELLETMDLLDIVNLYRRWLGLPAHKSVEVVNPPQEAA